MAVGEPWRRILDWPASGDAHDDLGGVRVARGRFHLGFRLAASRVYELLAPEAEVGHWPSRRVRLTGSLLLDSAWAVALTRSRRPLLWPRAASDAVDLVAWGVPAVKLDHTMAPGVPLTVDAVTDLGAVGFAVPLVNWVIVRGFRRRRGLDTPVASVMWQVTAGVIALGLRNYARQQDRAQRRLHETEVRARESASFLRGQHAVAAGADNIVDLLARTEPLVASLEPTCERGRSGTAHALHTWKAQLADTTRKEGAYLASVLVQVAQRRQTSDLSTDVVFDVADGDRLLVLSAQQAEWLSGRLLADHQIGRVPVEVITADGQRVGSELLVRVGAAELVVPSDPGLDVRAVDVAPVAILAGGLWCAGSALPAREHVAVWAVVPAVSMAMALAAAVHRARVARRPWSTEQVVLAMLVAQALYAPLATRTMRRGWDDAGLQHFPQLGGFLMAAPALLGMHDPAMSDRTRARLGAAAVAATVPGFLAGRDRVVARHLAASSILPLTGWISARGVARGLAEHQESLRASLERESAEAQAQGYREGEWAVIHLVEDAVDELAARVERLRSAGRQWPDGDEVLLTEARHRLDSAIEAVAALRARSGGQDRAAVHATVATEEEPLDA